MGEKVHNKRKAYENVKRKKCCSLLQSMEIVGVCVCLRACVREEEAFIYGRKSRKETETSRNDDDDTNTAMM